MPCLNSAVFGNNMPPAIYSQDIWISQSGDGVMEGGLHGKVAPNVEVRVIMLV